MSLINFLNPKLKPTVNSEAICEDGYSVDNLITDNEGCGFIGFAVTKPPVEIVFGFPKAIDLKVLKLWNSFRNLRSTSFEVYGKLEDGVWERVGFVRNLDKVDTVTFCYQSDYNSRSKGNAFGQHIEKSFFFKTACKILSNTNSLKIVIKSTNKCPPVLQKVQVWGLPSRTLQKIDRELIRSIWDEITNTHDDESSKNIHSIESRLLMASAPELNEHSKLKIPEEFLDSITWELMIFPTVLPSGKVIDQSTIDKHVEAEAKWGRMPSDPFTGLEFTPHRKAVLNPALKSRIEKFLMENAEHFKTVPRSLGRSWQYCTKYQNAYQNEPRYHLKRHYTVAGACSSLLEHQTVTSGKPSAESSTIANSTLHHNKSIAPELTPQISKRYKINVNNVIELSMSATQTSAATASVATAFFKCPSSEGSITDTIDHAIESALQKITRYSYVKQSTGNGSLISSSCIRCQSDEFAYEISTCNHLVCRECLMHLTKEQVCICNTIFSSANIKRFHKV